MTKFLITLVIFQGCLIYYRYDHTHTRAEVIEYVKTAHEMGRESIILEAME